MNKQEIDLKKIVKEKYGEIARQSMQQNSTSCCGATGSCFDADYTIFNDRYENMEGYNPDADLGLGCGIPTEFARIKEGDTVIDLGSGAGNDCFVARALTGPSGTVIGIDMTEAMVEKARLNAGRLGYDNVQFRLGDIEKMPVSANKANVVISNCVLNLVPDKQKAFAEIYRVLKPGGHLSISDVVLEGTLPEKLQQAAEMYAGCVSGAIPRENYLKIMKENGLINISIQKEKPVTVPDEILRNFITEDELAALKKEGAGLFSITVYAEKPVQSCGCGCNCSS